jgi:ethanolamine permease
MFSKGKQRENGWMPNMEDATLNTTSGDLLQELTVHRESTGTDTNNQAAVLVAEVGTPMSDTDKASIHGVPGMLGTTNLTQCEDPSLLGQFVQTMNQVYEEAIKEGAEVEENTLVKKQATPDIAELIKKEAGHFFGHYLSGAEEKSTGGAVDAKGARKSVAKPRPSKEEIPESGMSWREWLHQVVLMDVYPETCKTPQEFFQVYLERRKPPTYKASFRGMFGMAVCNVISGEFSGWNPSIFEVGYGHFWLGNVLAGTLYFVLADCLGELSTSLPVLGGSFAYSRALLGNFAGFIVGNSENLMYCMFVTLINCTFSDALKLLYPESAPYAPLVWLLLTIPCTYLVAKRNRLCWKIVEYGAWLCFFIIGLFVLFAMVMFNVGYLDIGWDDLAHENCLQSQTFDKPNRLFLTGFIGPFVSLPSTAWWFLGLEAASLFSKESKKTKYVPRSLYISWFSLAMCMVTCSIFGVLVPPGTGSIARALFPMASVLEATIAPSSNAFIFIVMPSLFVNMIASLMSASRQTYALSRSGYLPSLLSITSNDCIPARAAIFTSFYSFLTCFLVEYLHIIHGNVPILQALVSSIVISGSVAYAGIGITYIVFHFQYPRAARPYKSYTGVVGAIVLILLSLSIIFVQAGVNVVFQLTCAAYAAKMAISGAYFFFHGRLHLKPTEESLVTSFWKKG